MLKQWIAKFDLNTFFFRPVLVYLLAYNFACCLGWLYVLVICVKHIANNRWVRMGHWLGVQCLNKNLALIHCGLKWSLRWRLFRLLQYWRLLTQWLDLSNRLGSQLFFKVKRCPVCAKFCDHFVYSVLSSLDSLGRNGHRSSRTELYLYCACMYQLGAGGGAQIPVLYSEPGGRRAIPSLLAEIQVSSSPQVNWELWLTLPLQQLVRGAVPHGHLGRVGLHVPGRRVPPRIRGQWFTEINPYHSILHIVTWCRPSSTWLWTSRCCWASSCWWCSPTSQVTHWVKIDHWLCAHCSLSPGSPKMYNHMVKTRKNQLSGEKKDKKKESSKAKWKVLAFWNEHVYYHFEQHTKPASVCS